MEEKIEILSKTIVNYSIKVKSQDKVLITYENTACKPLIKQLIKDIRKSGGVVDTKLNDHELSSMILETANENVVDNLVNKKTFEVNNYDCFITICYTENEYENKNVDENIRKLLGSKSQKIDDIRINERRWVLLNYPSLVDSYKAHMTTDEFTKYAMDVMTVNYSEMLENIRPLKELMEKTDKVHIKGPNTDITFSIKGMPAVPCCGESNIPDGELFTAPVKNSVNGIITYNTPSPYNGNIYHDVHLEFENGKIINCSCRDDIESLKKIFDTDEGARYIGEFSLGFNPKILYPMGDILYDEKIMGSLHFTPGRCYDDADNGNISAIHWDLVLIQREEFGGGEVYFDDVLIRKNGKFVLDSLKNLNY